MPKRVWFVCLIGLMLVSSYVGLIRPWHHRWGATDFGVGRSLPGDQLTPAPKMSSTRAVTIQATPAQI